MFGMITNNIDLDCSMSWLFCLASDPRRCCFWPAVLCKHTRCAKWAHSTLFKESGAALKSIPFQTIHLRICRWECLLSLPQCFPQTAWQTGTLVLLAFLPKMQKSMREIVTHSVLFSERAQCNPVSWLKECLWRIPECAALIFSHRPPPSALPLFLFVSLLPL